MGNCWGRGKRNGVEVGEGGQYTANLGSEWTGILATTEMRDFQVSKGRGPRVKGRDFQATKGDYLSKGLRHAPPRIYHANCVYIVLIKDCV